MSVRCIRGLPQDQCRPPGGFVEDRPDQRRPPGSFAEDRPDQCRPPGSFVEVYRDHCRPPGSFAETALTRTDLPGALRRTALTRTDLPGALWMSVETTAYRANLHGRVFERAATRGRSCCRSPSRESCLGRPFATRGRSARRMLQAKSQEDSWTPCSPQMYS